MAPRGKTSRSASSPAARMFAGDWSLADGPATVETARERLAESRLGEPARRVDDAWPSP